LSFSSDFFLNKFGFSLEQSGDISSFLPIGTTIFTPLFGLFVDRRGKSATLMIFGSLLLFIVHLTFALTYVTPYFLMVILGIAFSLIPAAMWPAVAKIVDEKKIGTAYGLMFTIQNAGLALFPILAGVLLDKANPPGTEPLDYTSTILMFAALGLVGLFFAILLKRQDKISGYGLELPSNKKA
jgi:MFS family permease